jgi:hypothetical protein
VGSIHLFKTGTTGKFLLTRWYLRTPRNAGNFLGSWATISFSRMITLHGIKHLSTSCEIVCAKTIHNALFEMLETVYLHSTRRLLYTVQILTRHSIYRALLIFNFWVFLDIIHFPVYLFIYLHPNRRQGLDLSIGPNWVGFYLKTETESSLRNWFK